jgi:anti-sigma factor RsiW
MSDEDEEEKILDKISDYLDDALEPGEKAEVKQKIADDAEWKRVHDELVAQRDKLSGMQRARAPATFASEVTDTIHKRSAGRFFARRTLGDRVPFGALVIVAVVVLAIVGYVMWSSSTGSLKVDHHGDGDRGSASSVLPKL